jgi:hypothetical protein
MSSQTYKLQLLIYDATLNASSWAKLSFSVAADDTVTGSFVYIGPPMEVTGRRIPGPAGSQDNYELDGEEVSMRLSSYPAYAQFPVAGVASINEQGPFYIMGKLE